jgi:hypothetical protein
MMRVVIVAVLIGAAVFAGIYLVAFRSSGAPDAAPPARAAQASPGSVQRDQGEGGVELEVTFGGPGAAAYQPERYSIFLVSMNTHSVDLSGYDMVALSELRAGGKSYKALRWVSTADESHHRSGVLTFPKVDAGQPVELVIKTIAGVAVRTVRWAP